ncbi:MAG TPA: SRPBCC domain-containing protein [Puia sp.]|nr:SRPBCC domain-containing protein [Puia sp.]
MQNQDYYVSMRVAAPPEKAFAAITRVREWWASDMEGSSAQLNDSFTVHFGETFGSFKVVDFLPVQKIVWLTTDGHLHFQKNQREWVGTRLLFEVTPEGDGSRVEMTHLGLVPGKECFEECNAGWNYFIKESLFGLITNDQGLPQSERVLRIS